MPPISKIILHPSKSPLNIHLAPIQSGRHASIAQRRDFNLRQLARETHWHFIIIKPKSASHVWHGGCGSVTKHKKFPCEYKHFIWHADSFFSSCEHI